MGKLGDMDVGAGIGDKHYRPAKTAVCEWHECPETALFRENLKGPFLGSEIDVCPTHAIEVRKGKFMGEIDVDDLCIAVGCREPRVLGEVRCMQHHAPLASRPEAPAHTALEQANDLVYGDRAKAYGPADENHTAIAKMMDNWLTLRYPSGEYHDLDAYDSCMFNLMQKISRLAHSLRVDPMNPHRDSLVDGAGYFGVMAKIDDERRAKALGKEQAPGLIKQAMDGGGTA